MWRWSSTRTPTGTGCSTPRKAAGSFKAKIKVPSKTPYGLYDGAVVVSGHGQKSIVPISVNVAATAKQDETGQLTESLSFGGDKVAAAQANQMYNNGAVYDAKDWGWRPESGDWRYFYFDVPTDPPAGTQFLAQSDFAGPSPHNDIDTLVFGPTTNEYQLARELIRSSRRMQWARSVAATTPTTVRARGRSTLRRALTRNW